MVFQKIKKFRQEKRYNESRLTTKPGGKFLLVRARSASFIDQSQGS